MKFKVDESLPHSAAVLLTENGFPSETVFTENISGINDEKLAEICRAEKRILLTLDQGFGDIQSYPPADYPGFIILRLPKQDRDSILAQLNRVIELLDTENPSKKLWIVESQRVRVRE